MRAEDLTAVVITSVADAIGLKETRISPESSLIDELGAESIDLLDMWFRIHRDSGVEISGAGVAALLRGDIPGDEFAERGGLAHLERVLPRFRRDSLADPLRNDQVHSLETVGNLIDLVHSLAAQHRTEATPLEVETEPDRPDSGCWGHPDRAEIRALALGMWRGQPLAGPRLS